MSTESSQVTDQLLKLRPIIMSLVLYSFLSVVDREEGNHGFPCNLVKVIICLQFR